MFIDEIVALVSQLRRSSDPLMRSNESFPKFDQFLFSENLGNFAEFLIIFHFDLCQTQTQSNLVAESIVMERLRVAQTAIFNVTQPQQ